MIYVDINDIRMEFRRAFAKDPSIDDDADVTTQVQQLGEANNCRIIGGFDAGGWHCTDGIEFPDEASLMWFKLRWG